MSKQGVMPARPEKANIPVCSEFMHAKATLRPWRKKSSKQYDAYKIYTTGRIHIGRSTQITNTGAHWAIE